MNVTELWRSSDPMAWEQALQRYWHFVQPRNIALERALDALDLRRLQNLSPQGWYDFLHDEYFRWEYTAPNRYATTTIQLRKCVDGHALDELESIRQQLLSLDLNDVRAGLKTAKKIRNRKSPSEDGLYCYYFLAFASSI